MLKAIIFDMDGLMVDTEPLSRQAWDSVLGRFGYALTDEVYLKMIGRRSDESSQIAWSAYKLPITAEELLVRKTVVFQTRLEQGIPVMPGLMPLQAEVARRQIPWAVATSSPYHHAETILSQLGLADACHAIAAGNEVVHGKPAPDIYLLAAVAAGMVTVAVPNSDTQSNAFAHTHYVLPSLHAILSQLDELLTHREQDSDTR